MNLLQTFGLVVGIGLLGCSGEDAPTQSTGTGDNQTGASTQSGTGTLTTGSTGTDDDATSFGSTGSTGTPGTDSGASSGGMATTGGMQVSVGGATTGGNASVTTGSTAAGGATTTAGGDTDTTGGNTNTTGSTTTEGAGGTATTGGATTGGTIDPCTVTTPLSGGTQRCSNGLGDLSDGYSWEVWMDSGSNCATYYGVGAAFRQEWNLGGGGDAIARAGLYFGSTQTHDQIGTISASYAFTKPSDNGFSWVAVYGWTFEPLTEYYIVEDSSVFVPATDYEFRGSLDVDGGTYDIYYNRRTNAASPAGTTDFDQYWSIRTEPRQCGHVSISAHFNEWNSLGMSMGLLRESMLLVEALNGSGTVDFTYANVVVD